MIFTLKQTNKKKEEKSQNGNCGAFSACTNNRKRTKAFKYNEKNFPFPSFFDFKQIITAN